MYRIVPHCGFKPQEEDVKVNVNVALEQLELDLDKLYQKWTANLIDSLQDPSTQQDFELLDPKVQQRLKEIVSQCALPENIDTTLLSSIKSVLSGLIPVYLSFEALKKSLSGAPCTKEEFRKRFERYLDTLTQGQDQTKVRDWLSRGGIALAKDTLDLKYQKTTQIHSDLS